MKIHSLLAVASISALLITASRVQATPASEADKTFVGNVSQGGAYEVEASKLAAKRATAMDVRDLAFTEVHDHDGVNKRLKKIADAAGVSIAPELNSTFHDRLEKLKAVAAIDFDAAYIEDMKSIHDKDEKLFAKEAVEGTGDFKAFAHQTDAIVKRHIGALHGTD